MKTSDARDLILLFVRRDFVATCKQTVLGPLWYLIQPLLTALTFTARRLFGRVARLPHDSTICRKRACFKGLNGASDTDLIAP